MYKNSKIWVLECYRLTPFNTARCCDPLIHTARSWEKEGERHEVRRGRGKNSYHSMVLTHVVLCIMAEKFRRREEKQQ